mmetsp:Transcript_7739/g.14463  ORF Transcript_7739/g.14463 Transcript_7739/m.14463 type:complete len:245 (+) Transcript_7739:744-1478(+)
MQWCPRLGAAVQVHRRSNLQQRLTAARSAFLGGQVQGSEAALIGDIDVGITGNEVLEAGQVVSFGAEVDRAVSLTVHLIDIVPCPQHALLELLNVANLSCVLKGTIKARESMAFLLNPVGVHPSALLLRHISVEELVMCLLSSRAPRLRRTLALGFRRTAVGVLRLQTARCQRGVDHGTKVLLTDVFVDKLRPPKKLAANGAPELTLANFLRVGRADFIDALLCGVNCHGVFVSALLLLPLQAS